MTTTGRRGVARWQVWVALATAVVLLPLPAAASDPDDPGPSASSSASAPLMVPDSNSAGNVADEAVDGFMLSGRAGEKSLRRSFGQDPEPYNKCMRPNLTVRCRFPDTIQLLMNNVRVLHESKVGYTYGMLAHAQIKKDVALMLGDADIQIVWHFYASATTGKIGASKKILDELANANIPYVVHLPG